MKKIQQLYLNDQNLAKKNHSGYLTIEEFNVDVQSVSLRLQQILYSVYLSQNSSKALDMLMPFIESNDYLTTENGTIPLEANTMHLLTVDVYKTTQDDDCGKNAKKTLAPAIYLHDNQISETTISYVRSPNALKNRFYYINENNNYIVLPNQQHRVKAKKLIYAPQSLLVYDITATANGFSNIYNDANTIDILWDMDAYNILSYMLLEKHGLQVREMLLMQFATAGIQTELL